MSNYYNPGSALRALLEAKPERAQLALEAVIAEIPEILGCSDDMSSHKLVEVIFAVLAGIDE